MTYQQHWTEHYPRKGAVVLGTKADTLARCEPFSQTRSWRIPCSMTLSAASIRQDIEAAVGAIQNMFPRGQIIVRSSAASEDTTAHSNAGHYTTISRVNSTDSSAITKALTEVIGSYYGDSGDQVLVQTLVSDIALCGVCFSCDIDTHAPYWVVSYDQSGANDAVTSGRSPSRTYIRARYSGEISPIAAFSDLFVMMEDLEHLTGNSALDVEFLVDTQGQLWLLQVRGLTTTQADPVLSRGRLQEVVQKIQGKVTKLSAPHPFLRGRKGMFSVMTDWNPAEMIGIRPKRLALSLYKRLITDGTWAYQRNNYGYRNLRGFPLLISLYGAPYIDVRVCFNSFIPATLDDSIAEKLVNYYMERLRSTPTDHDKVEFNVVFSCYDFSLRSRLNTLREHGFNDLELDRITFSLLQLTNNIIAPTGTIHAADRAKIELLEPRFLEIHHAGMPLIDTIHWLIEDCVRYGTLPFAGLARGGFIAMQLLRSLVTAEILNDNEYHLFMNSLATVSKTLASDVTLLQQGALPQEEFLARYGHLRPGTYDITSPRYDEAFDTYFSQWNQTVTKGLAMTTSSAASPFTLSKEKTDKLDTLIRMNGLQTTPTEILHFIRHAIEGRELGKFLFTKNLSMVLRHIASLGARYDLTPDDMAHVDIQAVTNLYSSLGDSDVGTILRDSIRQGKELHTITRALRLPQLISVPADVEHFMASEVEPNFITQRTVTTMVILEEDLHHHTPAGKIVFIKSADPGYDWLFSHNIAGLVTMYGGANSHMAIRCAELSIPAVIGCGEHHFDQWCRHAVLSIDCENRHVNPVQP